MESNQTNPKSSFIDSISNNWFTQWIKNNKLNSLLLLMLIVILIWSKIKNDTLVKKFEFQKNEIVNTYEVKLDSLNIAKMELTSRVFSWAVRGEMIRDNLEQVDQLFLTFIKEHGISKLQLINPTNGLVMVASDKKDEGQLISNDGIISANELYTVKDTSGIKIITPIMGLNKKIGVLVIDVKN